MARRPVPAQKEKLFEFRRVPMLVIGAIIATLIAALFSFAALRKQAELDRLDRQIGELYGPLDGIIATNTAYWRDFCAENCPNSGSFFGYGPSAEADVRLWRNYIRSSAMPDVARMTDLIETKRALIIGEGQPKVFLDLSIHAKAYQLLAQSWPSDDRPLCPAASPCPALYSATNVAATPWPANLGSCVSEDLAKLRALRVAIADTVFLIRRPKLVRSGKCD
jgi:hypothetical protein